MKKRAEQSTTQQVTEAIADSNRAARNFDRRSNANMTVQEVARKIAFEAAGYNRLISSGQLVVNPDDSADAVLSWTWMFNGETLDLATSLHMSEQERDNLTELWLLDQLWRKGHGSRWLRDRIRAVQDAQRPSLKDLITGEAAAAATKAAVDVAVKMATDKHWQTLRTDNIALVTEMVAGAGFELTHGRASSDGFATWEQVLPERSSVKVTLALNEDELLRPPAQVFRIVFDQVGAK